MLYQAIIGMFGAALVVHGAFGARTRARAEVIANDTDEEYGTDELLRPEMYFSTEVNTLNAAEPIQVMTRERSSIRSVRAIAMMIFHLIEIAFGILLLGIATA